MNGFTKSRFLLMAIATVLLLLLAGMNMAYSGHFQHSGLNGLYLNGQGLATATPVLLVESRGVPMELRVNQTPVAKFDGNGMTVANQSLVLRYQDVAAAPSIRAQATVLATVSALTTNILGIETPRNLNLTYTTATTATAGNITVAGVDARGNSTTELIAVSAVSGTQTLAGVVPWVSITSITLPTRTENVTLTVAGGQKFGLPLLPSAAGDLYHLTVNATPQTAPTVNTTYGTFDPVSTPAANVDYNVWIKQ